MSKLSKYNRLALALALGMSFMPWANEVLAAPTLTTPRSIQAPTNQKGEQLFPQYSGGKYKYVSSGTEAVVNNGAAVLLGVYLSTGATTSFVTFRDTGTADGSGAIALTSMTFQTSQSSYPGGLLPFPIRFTKGITVQLQGTLAAGENATVIYLPQE